MYKKELCSLIIKGIIGFFIGIAFITNNTSNPELPGVLLFAFFFSGLPYGWQLSGRVVGGWMVIGSIPVMMVAFLIRFIIALATGWIAYPIALVYHIVKVISYLPYSK